MSAIDQIFRSSRVDTMHQELSPGGVKFEGAFLPRAPVPASLKETKASQRLRDFLTLVKPEITIMVMASAGVACVMASKSLNFVVLFHAVLGTGLVAAGAATLNQYLERALDATMRRTSKRPLPSERLTAHAALMFGIALSVGGTIYLFFFLNALTGAIGLFTLFSYLFIYTPLKRKTTLCTLIGAVPGAAPVLMGWAAAGNGLAPQAWILFAILFLWQFPHFYAIGWLYREDYARAGMLMLPAIDKDDGETTFRQILVTSQLLIIASLLPAFIATAGRMYFFAAMTVGLSFYVFVYRACRSRTKLGAKHLLLASVTYLPLLYLMMILDRLTVLAKTK